MMKHFHIGQRTLKTCIALLISLGVYIVLLLCNRLLGFTEVPSHYVTSSFWYVPTNFYTPFFAGIAVCYALQQSVEQSKAQAKLRSVGSIIGGYFGFLIVVFFEMLVGAIGLTKGDFSYYFLLYALVVLGVFPLMRIITVTRTGYAGFITCLTYLSVTISIRNGGMDAFLFTNNRILSTIVGVCLALYVNSFPHIRHKNKNILFLCGMDGVLYDNHHIVPENLYRLRDISNNDMKFTYMTSRCAQYAMHSLYPAIPKDPMIVMNGCAIYHPSSNSYSDVVTIPQDIREKLDVLIQNSGQNAFTFVYNEQDFFCYYQSLEKAADRSYFELNKQAKLNLVQAKVPSQLPVSMYLMIDRTERIDMIKHQMMNIKGLMMYEYPYRQMEGYSILRIMYQDASKGKALQLLKKYLDYDYVVCIGGRAYDEDAMDASDFSVCLNKAAINVKERADYRIDSNDTRIVIDFVQRVFYKKNYLAYLNALRTPSNPQ